MSKKAYEIKPNYAPVYAASMYPDLAKIFQKNGYALAVHGSLAKDFDLLAIPWIEKPSKPEQVIKEITDTFYISILGEPMYRPLARYVFTLGFMKEFSLDLSFFPFWNGEDKLDQ